MFLKNSLSARFMVSVAAIIIVMMLINLFWSIGEQKKQAEAQMRQKAAVIAEQLIATRAFIASRQDVINYDSAGHFEFKHLNPAAVGKEIGYLFNQSSGYKIKQTRFNVRDENNAPDLFERQMLSQLAAKKELTEIYGYDTIDGTKVFRYLVPLYYDNSCLGCHGSPAGATDIAQHIKEGYRAGEFAGAISIVFPLAAFEENIKDNAMGQLIFIVFIVVITISAMYLLLEYIIINPIGNLTDKLIKVGQGELNLQADHSTYAEMQRLSTEFNTMATKLQKSYTDLEDKVAERTKMLAEANKQLVKQGEELMVMNSKLSEADELKSEFLAVMSHELRTPLTSIIAFSETLAAEAHSLSAHHKEFINDISDSACQLLTQINNILDMSKIEANLVKINRSQIDASQIIASVSRAVAPLIAGKNISYTVNIAADLPLVYADSEKFTHILRNLISNAVKFTPAGKSITVTAQKARESEYSIKISVQDTGIGIAQEDLEHIFEKFYRPEKGNGSGGTGLGLAIVKNFVELQGGKIWAESWPGKGSIFTFILP